MTPQEQFSFDQSIGQELLKCAPAGWPGIVLIARLTEGPSDSWSLRIVLERRPPGPGVAFVSPTLEHRVAEMFAAHKKAATDLVEARYVLDNIDQSPSIVSEFEYRD